MTCTASVRVRVPLRQTLEYKVQPARPQLLCRLSRPLRHLREKELFLVRGSGSEQVPCSLRSSDATSGGTRAPSRALAGSWAGEGRGPRTGVTQPGRPASWRLGLCPSSPVASYRDLLGQAPSPGCWRRPNPGSRLAFLQLLSLRNVLEFKEARPRLWNTARCSRIYCYGDLNLKPEAGWVRVTDVLSAVWGRGGARKAPSWRCSADGRPLAPGLSVQVLVERAFQAFPQPLPPQCRAAPPPRSPRPPEPMGRTGPVSPRPWLGTGPARWHRVLPCRPRAGAGWGGGAVMTQPGHAAR